MLVPDATSDYLLGATTYAGVQLVPAKADAAVAGLVSTRLPPGTDPTHRASVWVTLVVTPAVPRLSGSSSPTAPRRLPEPRP